MTTNRQTPRASYGMQSACRHCDQDIQWLGGVHKWRDRGGNRKCVPVVRKGEVVTPKTSHKPV